MLGGGSGWGVVQTKGLFFATTLSPEPAGLANEVLGTKSYLADGDSMALFIVARSLYHVAVADKDCDVVDLGGAVAKEDEVARLPVADRNLVGAVIVLGLRMVHDRTACASVDRVLCKSRAVKTDDVAVIAVRRRRLLCALCWSVVVAATPAVRILSNHAACCGHNLCSFA